MIKNWNKFNESNSRVDEYKNMINVLKSDIELNKSDIEQLVFNLTDNYDLSIIAIREGFVNKPPELMDETSSFDNVSIKTIPFIREYITPERFIHISDTEEEKKTKAERVNLMNFGSLKDTIQDKRDRLFYCYFVVLQTASNNDYGQLCSELKEYPEILEELKSIQKRGKTLIGGYCTSLVYLDQIGILLFVELDKNRFIDSTRPNYYNQLPEQIREEMHDFIVKNNMSSSSISELITMLNKLT